MWPRDLLIQMSYQYILKEHVLLSFYTWEIQAKYEEFSGCSNIKK